MTMDHSTDPAVARAGAPFAADPVAARVAEVVTPFVADLGLELYDVEHVGGILRVVVDTPPGRVDPEHPERPQGVSIDAISLLTRLLSREFDHAEPLPGRYTLEVTSPGLERSLRLPRHYAREVGKRVSVRLRAPVDGVRRVQGALLAAGERSFTVRDDETLADREIDYAQVDRARTIFEWGPAPRPGRGTPHPARAATPHPKRHDTHTKGAPAS